MSTPTNEELKTRFGMPASDPEKNEQGYLKDQPAPVNAPLANQEKVLTEGEKAVGITFNPGKNPQVEKLKRVCADAIDAIAEVRDSSSDGEVKAMAITAKRSIQAGQMWAVKAATWES